MSVAAIPTYTVWAIENLVPPGSLPGCISRVSQEEAILAGRYGQIHPLLVDRSTAQDGYLQILSGFSTFFALKDAGLPQIACRILPQDIPDAAAFALRILHDRQDCRHSPMLQAWYLKEAHDQLSIEEVLPLLSLMGLKPHPHVLMERIRLLQLDGVVQAAVHNQELHIKNLVSLLRLPQGEQKVLIELIRKYRLGGSKQRTLVDLLVELHLREGRSIEEILTQWRKNNPSQDNLPQESQSLLDFLLFLSNPRLAQAEARFEERLHCLLPPPKVRVFHTPAFEDEHLRVQLNYSSWSTLQAHWPQLLKAVERGNQEP